MKRTLCPRPRILLVAPVLLAACSLGQVDSTGDIEGRPEVSDTSGREAVPSIQLITKTKAEDSTRYEMSSLIVESWQNAGIDAELLPVGEAELNARTFEGKDYDAYTISYGPTPERLDPNNLLVRFYSANAKKDGTNVSLFRNDEYDAAYLAQTRAENDEARRDAVYEAQQILYDQVAAIPVVYPTVGGAYRSDRWENISPSLGYPLFNVWNMTSATPTDDRDTIVVGTTFEPPTLNPVIADTLESQLPLSMVYDTLLAVDPNGETVNRAAESVESDGANVTVKLRAGMTFSDGKPVTAEDVAFTVNYLRDHGAPLFASGLEPVTSVTATDELTVRFTLENPLAAFEDAVLTQMPILPQHVWSNVSDPNTFTNDKPVSSGPFTIVNRDIGVSITFEANPRHYEPPQVSTMELVIVASPDAGAGGLESGELDLYDDEQPPVAFRSLEGAEAVTVVETESHGWRGLHLNTSRPPFDNLHFRKALADLIPYDDIIEIALQGDAEPGGSVIAPRLDRWSNPDLTRRTYDPDAAMAELEDGGYAFGPDDRLYLPDDSDGGTG